jgi:hypothetical protein
MNQADEATFISMWQQGLETAAIAQRLGIKATTAQSRAYRLQQRGLIQPRPRGGNYPTLRAQERGGAGEGVSAWTPGVSQQTPGVSTRVSGRVSKGVPVEVIPSLPATSGSPEMTPLLQEILQELRTLTQGLAGRVSEQTPPVSGLTPQVSDRVSPGVSLGPREKTERWNLHLPKDLIAHTKARAKALGVHPSELVAELLRRWLAEGSAS